MMFNSRGFKDAAASKGAALQKALLDASEDGKLPIVVDTSPCLSQVCGCGCGFVHACMWVYKRFPVGGCLVFQMHLCMCVGVWVCAFVHVYDRLLVNGCLTFKCTPLSSSPYFCF